MGRSLVAMAFLFIFIDVVLFFIVSHLKDTTWSFVRKFSVAATYAAIATVLTTLVLGSIVVFFN